MKPERPVVRPSVGREVDEELAFHVEMRVRELVASGWTEDDARAEAVRRFGDLERVKSECRDLGEGRDGKMSRRDAWDELRQDLRFALRQLRRERSFTLVAVTVLALAIGANTAVFSVVDGVLLRPLPYPDADRLVAVWTRYLPPSGFDIDKFDLSGPEVLDLTEATATLATVGVWNAGSVALTGGGEEAERIRIGRFSRSMFDALAVPARLGRWITAEEDAADAAPVIVLGHDLWVARFGADPGVVGRSIEADGRSMTVVGVMPEGFAFPDGAQAWTPLRLERANAGGRAGHGYGSVARLADGASPEDLTAELDVLNDRWAAEHEHNVAHFLWAQSLKTELVRDAPRILGLLLAAVGLVLLIACANVANLLLARGERRHAELGLRGALGAGRARIVRQLVTESVVLAGAAAALGLGLAWVGTKALLSLDPNALPRLANVGVSLPVVGFTVGAALVTAVLFGVGPALVMGRRSIGGAAAALGRSAGSRSRSRLRRSLVASEVALCLVVVVVAGLLTRSLVALTGSDPGFDAENVLSFQLSLPSGSYPDAATTPAFYRDVADRLGALPGVRAVGLGDRLPFQGSVSRWDFHLPDRAPRQDGEMARNARVALVDPGFFESLGIPLLEGRGFLPSDGPDDALVGVVSEAMARTWWPGERAVGKRWGYEHQGDDGETFIPWITVVGVVPEQYTSRVDEEVVPQVYLAHAQAGVSGYYWPRSMAVAVKTAVPPTSLTPAVRAAVAELDPDLPLADVRTLESAVEESTAQPRLAANLMATFGLLALVLAAVGIYGVVAYSVEGRTREIGVRRALGAGRAQVARLILREGSAPLVVGLAFGMVGAFLATRLVADLLYGVAATDPVTFVTVPLALALVGLAASLVPVMRATAVSPTRALREE